MLVSLLLGITVCMLPLEVASHPRPFAGLVRPPVTPEVFVRNDGQWPAGIEYLARSGRVNVLVGQGDVTVQILGSDRRSAVNLVLPFSPTVNPTGLEMARGRSHFFLGREASQWIMDAPAFRSVRVGQAWPGVDLVLGWDREQLTFTCHGDADDVAEILFRLEGADGVQLLPTGEVLAGSEMGTLLVGSLRTATAGSLGPMSVQPTGSGGPNQPKSSSPPVRGPPMQITPQFSSYFGGQGDEEAHGVANMPGHMLVAGFTESLVFYPTIPGGLTIGSDQLSGITDVFVAKLPVSSASSGTTDFEWASYLGGTGQDYGLDLAVNADGEAFVTGATSSFDFPTTTGVVHHDGDANGLCGVNKFDKGACDIFVAHLGVNGDALIYSTYIGGSGNDQTLAIAVDANDCVYLTGATTSTDYPIEPPGTAFGTVLNGGASTVDPDAFVTKLSADGTTYLYSTYISNQITVPQGTFQVGSRQDGGLDIAVDATGRAHVAVETNSPFMPIELSTLGCLGNLGVACGDSGGTGDDGYVCILDPSGTTLEFGRFLDGTLSDSAHGIDVDDNGYLYVVGYTKSTAAQGFPVSAATFQPQFQGGGSCAGLTDTGDAFVAKLDPSAPVTSSLDDSIVWCTYLGGSACDNAWDVQVDGAGRVYVVGNTLSEDFPMPGTGHFFDGSYNGGSDAFIVRLSTDGMVLEEGSFLGGSGHDIPFCLDIQNSPLFWRVAVAGTTRSPDFPLSPAPLTEDHQGAADAFVTRFHTPKSQ